MKTVCIIPARGGSKGLPLKNILSLNGKPLIAYTIENAKRSKIINRVIVSTDNKKIADISEEYGAEVIFRPREISDDSSPSELALLHVLEHLNLSEKYNPDLIVFLQCTSPLTLAEDIDGAIDLLIREKADCVLSASPFHHFLWKTSKNSNYIGINHDKTERNLRQEQTPQYLENGSIYVMRTEGFVKSEHRFFGKIALFIMPKERSIEIDDNTDFYIAESLLKLNDNNYRIDLIPEQISALVLDFDGVFTDNRVIIFENGQEAVICNRGDGMGLENLKNFNLPIMVLSKETNSVVKKRCNKLGLDFIQGSDNKLDTLKKWLKHISATPENAIYIGNDENDIPCLEFVGCPITVRDAHVKAKNASKITLKSKGGFGAIREISDLIIEKVKKNE
jgi:N-acylneuraminate cytidylyltransferase